MLADINGNLADLRSGEAMASQQRFCLRWNNHQLNLLSVFDQLLATEAFVDVTIAVDGHMLKAHKMVLSACSPYFQALFTDHPDRHPIVILKDVVVQDMRNLLDFMYRGEVSVDQDRLTAFLRVAENLRIKGLTEVNEDNPPQSLTPSREQSTTPQATTAAAAAASLANPPPSLHRINHHHHQQQQHHPATPQQQPQSQHQQSPSPVQLPQKRYHHVSSHPLLGSALTAPKRKRGRPRKLSGSSDTPLDSSLSTRDSSLEPPAHHHQQQQQQQQNLSGSELVQGSPEMLEMKMGLDFQADVQATHSAGSSGASLASNSPSHQRGGRDDLVTENGTENDQVTIKVEQPEPIPGTSALAKDEEFTRPLSRQESESLKQEKFGFLSRDVTLELCPASPPNPEFRNSFEQHPERPDDLEVSSDDDSANKPSTKLQQPQQNLSPYESSPDNPNESRISSEERPLCPSSDSRGESLLARVAPSSNVVPRNYSMSSDDQGASELEARKQLLEYRILPDGSVVCKWCGEVLPSRMRWYRHKYKHHVHQQAQNRQSPNPEQPSSDEATRVRLDRQDQQQQQQQQQPLQQQAQATATTSAAGTATNTTSAALFKCQSCSAYFKSRKGFVGHLSSRHHSDQLENDENNQPEGTETTVVAGNIAGSLKPSANNKRCGRNKAYDVQARNEWEQRREMEEKLVADIIDRVKRECEAQGEMISRRGYSRRQPAAAVVTNSTC